MAPPSGLVLALGLMIGMSLALIGTSTVIAVVVLAGQRRDGAFQLQAPTAW